MLTELPPQQQSRVPVLIVIQSPGSFNLELIEKTLCLSPGRDWSKGNYFSLAQVGTRDIVWDCFPHGIIRMGVEQICHHSDDFPQLLPRHTVQTTCVYLEDYLFS
jgi:hypothetical protein